MGKLVKAVEDQGPLQGACFPLEASLVLTTDQGRI
jgi:hypothetical protein